MLSMMLGGRAAGDGVGVGVACGDGAGVGVGTGATTGGGVGLGVGLGVGVGEGTGVGAGLIGVPAGRFAVGATRIRSGRVGNSSVMVQPHAAISANPASQ